VEGFLFRILPGTKKNTVKPTRVLITNRNFLLREGTIRVVAVTRVGRDFASYKIHFYHRLRALSRLVASQIFLKSKKGKVLLKRSQSSKYRRARANVEISL
jgi:hypothetical protein